jgi:hypothetical protein
VRPGVVEIFQETYTELRPGTSLPEFKVEFFAFANVNNTIRLRNGRLLVRLSDLLEGAPDAVLKAIAHILLAKMYRRPIDRAQSARCAVASGCNPRADISTISMPSSKT